MTNSNCQVNYSRFFKSVMLCLVDGHLWTALVDVFCRWSPCAGRMPALPGWRFFAGGAPSKGQILWRQESISSAHLSSFFRSFLRRRPKFSQNFLLPCVGVPRIYVLLPPRTHLHRTLAVAPDIRHCHWHSRPHTLADGR